MSMNPQDLQQQPQQIDPRIAAGTQPGAPDLSAANPGGDDLSSQQLIGQMNPMHAQLLQQQLQQMGQAPQAVPPPFDQTITTILGAIQQMTQQWDGGNGLSADVYGKGVHQLAQAAHFLAQAAEVEGQHIPAQIQLRLQAAQLDMQYEKQNQEMQLQAQQQAHDQQLAREMHNAKLQQLQHQSLMKEFQGDQQAQQQQQQHQQAMQHQEEQHQQQLELAERQQAAQEQQAQQAQQTSNSSGE